MFNYELYLERHPEFGIYVVKGTTVPVVTVLARIAIGIPPERIIQDIPVLTLNCVEACRVFGRIRAELVLGGGSDSGEQD